MIPIKDGVADSFYWAAAARGKPFPPHPNPLPPGERENSMPLPGFTPSGGEGELDASTWVHSLRGRGRIGYLYLGSLPPGERENWISLPLAAMALFLQKNDHEILSSEKEFMKL